MDFWWLRKIKACIWGELVKLVPLCQEESFLLALVEGTDSWLSVVTISISKLTPTSMFPQYHNSLLYISKSMPVLALFTSSPNLNFLWLVICPPQATHGPYFWYILTPLSFLPPPSPLHAVPLFLSLYFLLFFIPWNFHLSIESPGQIQWAGRILSTSICSGLFKMLLTVLSHISNKRFMLNYTMGQSCQQFISRL